MALYVKGQSGNPNGRPKGDLLNRKKYRDMLKLHGEELFNKALEHVRGGSTDILRMFLDRLLPAKPRDNSVPIRLTGEVKEQTAKVIELLSDESITPIEAGDLMNVIMQVTSVTDVQDLKRKLEALESK